MSFILLLAAFLFASPLMAATGSIEGTVLSGDDGRPLPGITVTVQEANQSAVTDAAGVFKFDNLTPGSYTVKTAAPSFTTALRKVEVTDGGTSKVDIQLSLNPLAEDVIVTASPYTQEALRTYQPTDSVSGVDLDEKLSGTLGETLQEEPGVNMRSFGPGNARPVIRGFDNDRVLVLEDGARTSDLSSQSGDHGSPIDPALLERIEVVRGPASLLYGSNAIGGVVNAITSELGHDEPFKGYNGHATFEYGTVNEMGSGYGHLDFGTGNFIVHAGGGYRNAQDYDTPEGKVPNSATRTGIFKVGGDYVNDRGHFGVNFTYDDLLYGLPFAAEFEPAEEASVESASPSNASRTLQEEEFIDVSMKRHVIRFDGDINELSNPFPKLRAFVTYVDYHHEELEGSVVGTTFDNRVWEYRVLVDQRKVGRLSGTIGLSGYHRDYESVGAEALAPFTIGNNYSLFAYEELGWEDVTLQFGGRLEHTGYKPDNDLDRDFTGFSGSVGILVDLNENSVFSANYGHAFRAPALEELYNNGPHIGNVSFEIGDPNLSDEVGNTIDFSLRHDGERIKGDVNFFYAKINDFIFPFQTGEIEDGLPVAIIVQDNARYYGWEAGINFGITNWLWAKAAGDYVNAELTDTGNPVPRIPPLRGRFGFDILYKGFTVSPEVWVVAEQDRVFGAETPTPGYTLLNIRGSYIIESQGLRHTITAGLNNATNELYRNHLSLIKQLAPEPGRGFKLSYSLNFY